MLIANPIYDVVFRYLMEDNRVAKLIIGGLLGTTVKELKFGATERTIKYDRYPTVLRMDFAALIETKKGETQQVIIELQKAKFYLEVMRFRKYLGKQYTNSDLKIKYKGKRGGTNVKGIPIIPIYILGEALTKEIIPVMRVGRYYIDVATNKKHDFRHEFIEALTHDAIFVQIPHLTGRRKTDLEDLLHIFDQSNISDTQKHLLKIREEDYPSRYQVVIRRLKAAMASHEVRETMEAEDDILDLLRNLELEAALAEKRAEKRGEKRAEERAERKAEQRVKAAKELAEQEAEQRVKAAKELAEQEAEQRVIEAKELAEQEAEQRVKEAKKLAEQEAEQQVKAAGKVLKTMVQQMASFGMNIDMIATSAGITIEEVKKMLE